MSDLVLGVHAVREGLRAGRGSVLWVQADNRRIERLIAACKEAQDEGARRLAKSWISAPPAFDKGSPWRSDRLRTPRSISCSLTPARSWRSMAWKIRAT